MTSTPNALVVFAAADLDVLPPDQRTIVLRAVADLAAQKRAIEARTITSANDVHDLNKDVAIARDAAKTLESARVALVSPMNDKVKIINRVYKAIIEPLQAVVSAGDQKFRSWQADEDRKARELKAEHDRRIAEAEAAETKRRADAEAARLEAERKNVTVLVPVEDQAKDALAEMGVTARQMAEAQIPPPPPAVTGVKTEGYGGMSINRRWDVVVMDIVEVAKTHPELLEFRKGAALAMRVELGVTDADGDVIEGKRVAGLHFQKVASVSHR